MNVTLILKDLLAAVGYGANEVVKSPINSDLVAGTRRQVQWNIHGVVSLLSADNTSPNQIPLGADLAEKSLGSGVLVHPRIVISAAHLVEDYLSESAADANSIQVAAAWLHSEDSDNPDLQVSSIAKVIIHRNYETFLRSEQNFFELPKANQLEISRDGFGWENKNSLVDIAIIVLKEPITAIRSIPLLASKEPLTPGVHVELTGYPEHNGKYDYAVRYPACYYDRCLLTGSMQIEKFKGVEAATYRPQEGSESSACFGDSGGPATLQEGKGLDALVGIVSRGRVDLRQDGEHPCQTGTILTMIPELMPWLVTELGALGFDVVANGLTAQITER